MRLLYVPQDRARDTWPHVSDLIKKAVERGGLGSYKIIQDMVLDGRALLWIACEDNRLLPAALVTSLEIEDKRTVCAIVAYAGTKELLPLLSGVEEYARAKGCQSMRLMGRKGWQRMLKDYQSKHVILEKDL